MTRLLVVDDSELIRNRLVDHLRAVPGVCEVEAVATLSQMLDRIYAAAPSLLILDQHLPDGNAVQVLGVLRKVAPATRIAILSNDASQFSRARCLKAGADAFYDKSREFEQLLDAVRLQARPSSDPDLPLFHR
jgi:DNA-binding NarL/FixJ family response regulator